MDRPTYGLIGRGRLATHLARYFQLEQLSYRQWHRAKPEPLRESVEGCDVLLLAISDDAIEPFVAANPEVTDRRVVHFSGSLVSDRANGLHPLMTFGPELYDHETYRAIPFVGERGGPSFDEVFPTLGNPSWVLETDLKPLYHALCVLAGNFTTMLWGKAFADFEQRLELPREVLLPYLERTAANTAAAGESALTGSLARGDQRTIDRDLAALEGDPYREVYQAFARAFAHEEVGP
ncbi:MAG: DUF2520 domain-containing protein [Holophagae bacterium]|jgi:predicted short-subunit dehydrogenase-like oxidoreductase (DUF2520 family)